MCQRCSRLKDPTFSCETKLNQLPSLVKIVWERYYSAMAAGPEISQRALAELVAQLGRMGYRDVDTGGLTPAQWTALRFFSRVNRFSRNVSAFAEFHGTTRGTASQTVKGLVGQGYLTCTPCERDGRSSQFYLTAKSKTLLSRDPFERLVTAAGTLSSSARRAAGRGLEGMLRALAEQQGKRPFGMCPSCRYFQDDGCCVEGEPEYTCMLVGEPLREEETAQLCVNFLPSR